MDPVTHGIIGLAISAFSGNHVSLNNPISVGCAIGAMSPDIDVVIRLVKDDFYYIRHHRGLSHSIPSLIGLSLIITFGLSFVYKNFSFMHVFLWTFLGAFSHTFFDILNSYGAKLFSPFTERKLRANLLMLYDPVITILCLFLIFKKNTNFTFYSEIVLMFLAYIGFRYSMKKRAENIITNYYKNGYKINKVNILPALMAFHKWDFIVESNSHNIVGQVNILNKKIKVRKKFKKPDDEIVELFMDTKVGRYFSEFSPIFHVVHFKEMDKLILKSIDLRYYFKNNFMHHATVIFDEHKNIIESFIHPYDINKKIYVAEES
ncbi:inner membrane protein [Caminicella sporogenes DSM 14501]|uniref:Inner membrane protein n=1 Tax=Caminicella sporogenes DSM 14501 TaxID=1121266 RepID=A0A1M6LZA7_9FIRM|nr:metal-dependent hydrolase [Caminicella sporogenes]RKD28001.1 hypothetical protein BET04_02785 [Caminicella sporogenes]SHJ76430.1 inner membrane protein [Caminicella sporogenes DSM 14501]